MMGRVRSAVLALSLLVMPLAQAADTRFATSAGDAVVSTIATGLEHPWGLAFLPDGRILVTERPGRVRLVGADGTLSAPLAGAPDVEARGQGGLLDIALAPDFATSRRVYFSFSETREGGNGTSVARARLSADATGFEDLEIIFRQQPAVRSAGHFGSRLVFDRAGNLFVTLGDRMSERDEAQNPANSIGKIVRITAQGAVPADNPKAPGWLPELWSIGHRNVQGAALNPATGDIWTAEHGARGGDEINIPRAGRNYGWPVITYGRDYSGETIGEGTAKEGMEQPVHYWDPSIAPSGMAFYAGGDFPTWQGSLLVGALAGEHLARLSLDGERVTAEETLFAGIARIRAVAQAPDGRLYLLTDGDGDTGALLVVSPSL